MPQVFALIQLLHIVYTALLFEAKKFLQLTQTVSMVILQYFKRPATIFQLLRQLERSVLELSRGPGKNAAQHASDLTMVEDVEYIKPAFLNP